MSTAEHTQAPRTAWINAMRAEVLRVGKRIPEVARVVNVGVWIATYADADGTNAFPSRETLATLAGCSQETVTRSVKVLMGVGALERRRRPNSSSMYQLAPVALLPGGLPWEEHLHHYTDTRQRKAHAKKKAEDARKASMDAVRGEDENEADSVHGRGPDSVHGGGSEAPGEDPDSVHGRPRTASTDAFRTASMAGVYKDSSTSGRDPRTDKEPAEQSPQPQQRVGARSEDDDFPGESETAAAAPQGPEARRCPRCHAGTIVRPDRQVCGGCIRDGAQKPVQGAFLLSLTGGGQGTPRKPVERVQRPVEDPAAPLRTCACGREHRLRDSGRCPDCLVAAEEERRALEAVSNG
ncbi:helix-turn-helix domain-containing protein [Streptomyces sp. NPDC059916]|uniref:helix-turn-helix domain-containing protein n=1 Tax=Streptomyces sp. NPDC059916 TaxID=3347001 RepID=UPI00367AD609